MKTIVKEFQSRFTGSETFLSDHVVQGTKILPGVAYLELARFGGEYILEKQVTGLRDVVWMRPIRVQKEPVDVVTGYTEDISGITYEISSESSGTKEIHSQGHIYTGILPTPRTIDLNAVRMSCTQVVSADQSYNSFRNRGLFYGFTFQGIKEMHCSETCAVSQIILPGEDGFVLSPGMLDSALQTCMGIGFVLEGGSLELPFSLRELNIYGALPEKVWCYTEVTNPKSRLKEYAIYLCDDSGKVFVSLIGFSALILAIEKPAVSQEQPDPVPTASETATMNYYQSTWKQENLVPDAASSLSSADTIVLVDVSEKLTTSVSQFLNCKILHLSSTSPVDLFEGVKNEILKSITGKSPLNLIVAGLTSRYHSFGFLRGLIKSAEQECSWFTGRIIGVEDFSTPEKWVQILKNEFNTVSREISYQGEIRSVRMLRSVDLTDNHCISFRPEGVYLITGGFGGLGVQFAQHISRNYPTATIILSGRRTANEIQQQLLSDQPSWRYIQTDVSDVVSVERLISQIKQEFGQLTGIIHAAGVLRDSLLSKKTHEEIKTVFGPKISGIINLDEATQEEPLDFMVNFSSVSAVLGNIGQSDYASANAYLDDYTHYRNMLVERGERHGDTLSINWPLWRSGGMQIDELSEQYLKRHWGMEPLPTKLGIEAFDAILKNGLHPILVLFGEQQKIIKKIPLHSITGTTDEETQIAGMTIKVIINQLKEICAKLLKLNVSDLDTESHLSDYGLDSIIMMKLLTVLEETYDCVLDPTMVIQHPSIGELGAYLIDNKLVAVEETLQKNAVMEPQVSITPDKQFNPHKTHGVAIIGISCNFPESESTEELWENLKNGRDLISEVPVDRSFRKGYYNETKTNSTSYSNKGGFMKNPAAFDIQYFKIKPEEAIAMDPQQRIVLELTRDLLASSGFEKEELAGTNTGVFIGAKDNNYIRNGYDLLPEGTHQHVIVNSISNMIAARVSDFYDLKGASQVIDTACSSSLVAIHQACEAILSGNLNMAIAGGISVMVDEYGHVGFSQANVLSANGKSCVFDERANGFVLGEGGGLVLLKDYGQAVLDGDRILAVVQGSAVNNDGQTMGVTVPNKQGQKDVIAEALAKSGVNPDQISYYEAHGTGTLLGDPIEINAASEVYKQQTDKTGFCAIGSVKSNLGHTMTAAGVTGLIKIILQIQHSELVPTIYCEKPHPRFKFNESPFYPITTCKKWDVQQKIAGISSFGFGGTNCHLIVSEATQDKMSCKRTPLKVQRQSANYWLGYIDPAFFEKEAVTDKTVVGIMPLTNGLENEIVRLIRDKIAQKISIQPTDILVDEGFMDLGLDSTVLIQLTSELGDEWNIELYPTLLFQYDTIRKFAAHIAATYSSELAHLQYKEPLAATVTETEEPQEIKHKKQLTEIPAAFEDEIAIIGMTARFPGAETLENYWENILKSKDLITEIPGDRWNWETYYGDEKKERGKTKAKFGGFISDIDKFDCKFFRVLPLEAQLMDPQHRITIEGVYHLFEHAGIAPEQMKGTDTGVFIGVSSADYATLINREKGLNQYAQYATGNTHSVLVNRISYLFDLHGPSIPIDTACSSSLIAISRAVESIRSGNCSMAVAGGVNIILSPELTLSFSQAGMLSKDGRCKTFDKKANGYVRSEGMGLILLKSKVAAERDGDHIYGIIKSVAENHGGKVSTLTSPNPNAQRNLIIQAIQKAGLHPNDISYIEAHGTGTPLGDPIETEALKMAFEELEGDSPLRQSNCALGSVKASIGHLESAAGIAGVIKTLLCLNHQTLGGNPHLKEPNELLKLNNSPFRLVKETESWGSVNQQVRTAGVSSFGFGGANAHVILQEYARTAAKKLELGKTLICLSAKTESQLLTIQKNLFVFLQKNSDCSLHDIAQTLLVGRDAMLIRAALVTDSLDDLKQQLEQVIHGKQSAFVSGIADMNIFNEQDTVIAVRQNLQASSEWESVMHSWLKGQPVNWKQFYNSAEVRRIELPGYPFLRERCWYTEIQEINTPKESYTKEFLPVDHVVGSEIGIEEFGNGIVMVKMQSRETKNMLDDQLIKSLTKTFSELEQRTDLKVVILTGYDNVFCMGGSQDILNGIANKKQKYTDAPFVYKGLLEFKVPVITAIQGMAVGGGLIFGLYGDIVYMDARSTYSSNFMKYGFTPGMGATYIMPKKLGQQLAQEMMYTARLIGGNELKERGATVKITSDVLKEAIRTAKELASKPKIALEVLKRNLSDRMLQDLQQHVREELEMHDKTFHTEEVRNLITATFNRPVPVNLENENTIVPIDSKVKLEHPDTVAARGVQPFISEPFRKVSLCDVRQSDVMSELKPITQTVSVESKREEQEIKADHQQAIMQSGSIIDFLKDCAAALLNLPANEIGTEDIFLDMGIDSISGVEFIRSVNDKFDLQLEAVLLYDYPNINALSAFIGKNSTGIIPDMPKKELTQLFAEPIILPVKNEPLQDNTADVTHTLKQIFGRMLNLPVEELSIDESFIDFGVDSISGVEAVRAINEQFDLSLETVILYDYFNIRKLANFIAGQLPEKTRIMAEPYYTPVKESVALAEEKQQQISATDIAIIGISGRFPQADNVDEFWTNLASGKDSVTEVPERKWSIADIYSKERGLPGKSYGKWMGAINDEDKFDSYFFNISPAEAKKMDPQQRVFLEEVWKTFEDAGYSPESLSESACGVFVGVGPGDYFDRFKKNELLDNHVLTGVTTSMLASRISYLLNLQGPAIAIDTACSSSLVALHQACSSLRNGECEMAIAGGVNIMTTESMHILTSKTEMLSEDGKCHTFDNQANGFVPGEAVGVALLKPLHQAINDKDNIYAVIKGSAVNQDGKTNGIMAPSANSQKKLIQQVLNRFDIDPGSISYVETHGTGTKLGDPIEIKALKEMYSGENFKPESCALGSVKTNIGHALTAAGISSLLKVVLSIKNKQIPPSLHYHQCNEHIQLSGTSFYVNTRLNGWKLPDSGVRRAAVSSFGYSGTNAHIVLEEFKRLPEAKVQDQERLFLFSAKNKERLVETVKLYCEFLQEKRNLNNVSYTLLTGREAMPERLAIVALTQADLLGTLQEYLKGTGANYTTGNIKTQVIHQQALQATNQRLEEIISSWLKGQPVNTAFLFDGENPEKISLPTYPFEKERHWVDIVYAKPIEAVVNTPLNEWIYKTTIAPDNPLVNDHKVQGRKIIPGVYYLQIVKEAMKQGFRLEVNRFRNVQLLDPGYIGQEPLIFRVEIKRNDQEFEYRITTEEHGQTKLKSQGFTSFSTEQPTVSRLGEEQCKLLSCTLESREFYEQLASMGLEYGPLFNGLKKLYFNENEAWAYSEKIENQSEESVFGQMDSCFQTCLGIDNNNSTLKLPFGIENLLLYRSMPEKVWTYARKELEVQGKTVFTVEIYDEEGLCLAKAEKVTVSPIIHGAASKPQIIENRKKHLYIPKWNRIKTGKGFVQPILSNGQHLIIGQQTDRNLSDSLTLYLKDKGIIPLHLDTLDHAPEGVVQVYLLHGLQSAYNHEDSLEQMEYTVFRAIKMLQESNFNQKKIELTVFTRNTQKVLDTDTVNPKGSGIVGIIGSLAKEQPGWTIRMIDLGTETTWNWDTLMFYSSNKDGAVVAYRNGFLFRSELRPLDQHAAISSKLKQNGVYLLLGGAGGIGRVTSDYLIKQYNAKVIWLGRREMDSELEKAIHSVGTPSNRPEYFQCDATKKNEVEDIHKLFLERRLQINGIFHSAIVLNDRLIKNMKEQSFKMAFEPKSLATQNLFEIFKGETLDFICFYSSIQSQVNAAGQSNYSAGCTYKDSYAHALQQQWKKTPVYIINWGYWGDVGIVSTDEYRAKLAASGLGSINAKEGMQILEQILAGEQKQLAAIKFLN